MATIHISYEEGQLAHLAGIPNYILNFAGRGFRHIGFAPIAQQKTRPGEPERVLRSDDETITPFFAGLATTYSPVP